MTGPAWTPGTGGGSSSTIAFTSKTSAYTIDNTDCMVDCTTGTFTVTLPTAVGLEGKYFIVKNSGSGIITIDAYGSETIDGVLNKILAVRYESLTMISDGTNWKVI